MDTKQVAAELRLTHWSRIMKERSESGLSVKAYCEKEGFHQNIYYYWQRKIREAACLQLAGHKKDCDNTGLTPVAFAEVRISETSGQTVPERSHNQGEIYFDIAGVRFAAGSNYPPGQIAELLRRLAQL